MLVIYSKIGQKEPKRSKNGQKLTKKRVILFVKISPSENVILSFLPSFLLTRPELCSRLKIFDGGICFYGNVTEANPPLLKNVSKKNFTDQNMIKAIAQNYAQTKGPTIKMNKPTFWGFSKKRKIAYFKKNKHGTVQKVVVLFTRTAQL